MSDVRSSDLETGQVYAFCDTIDMSSWHALCDPFDIGCWEASGINLNLC